MIALAADAGVALLSDVAPGFAMRMVSPKLFAVLVAAAGANCIIQSLATLLRSFQREPFLVQSLVVASLTLVFAALTAPRWGNAGAAFSYLAATAGIGLPFALSTFKRSRRGYLTVDTREARVSEAG
jgi:hypothetical protein